jgi:hypothetical protein
MDVSSSSTVSMIKQSPVHLWHMKAVISAFWFHAEVIEIPN